MAINSQILSKEQVLIVGCGDIGRRLAEYLPQTDYQVTGLRRHPPGDSPRLRYLTCDTGEPEQFSQILAADYPVIIVTMTPSERSDKGYQQAYVHTCRLMTELLHKLSCRPRLIVFVSSSAVYGQNDGSWVDENSPTQPDSFSGKRLLEAENIILQSGFASTVVRFSGIYGPDRYRLIDQVKRKNASASTAYTNRIHADDCARCLAHLIEYSKTHPLAPHYLATDSAPTPMVEVVSWLAEQLGVTDFLSDTAINERGNKRCSNHRLLQTRYSFAYPTFKEGYRAVLGL